MAKSALTKLDLVELVLADSEIKESRLSRKEISTIISKFIEKLKGSIEKLGAGGLGTFGVKRLNYITNMKQRKAYRKCFKRNGSFIKYMTFVEDRVDSPVAGP